VTADEVRAPEPRRRSGRARRTHRPWAVLARYPDFRRLFVGNSVSLLGSSVTTVALPLTAVIVLDASPVEMGVLGAVALAPQLVLGLPAGVWVDRFPYRRLLVTADLVQALLLGSIPVLAAFGMLRLWHLYVVATLAGAGNLVENVTAQSFVPSLVPRPQLLSANSALMLSNATVNTTGSALGAALVALLTAPIAITADAVSFVLAALSKARIRTAGPKAAALRKTRLWPDIVEGLRAVFAHRIVRAVTLSATLGALAGQMQGVVLVLYLVRDLGLSPGTVGVVVAIGGAAGILGAFATTTITHRIGPGPAFIAGMFLAAVAGLVLAAAAGPLPVALAIVAVAQILHGTGPPIYGVNQQTFRQALIAPALLARVNATWRFLVYGTQPVGALLGGLLGATLGIRATVLISSGALLMGSTIAVLSPLRSLRELPGKDISSHQFTNDAD
jgi:Transmembrane secretion effector